jgi:hypothetical protein
VGGQIESLQRVDEGQPDEVAPAQIEAEVLVADSKRRRAGWRHGGSRVRCTKK